MPRLEMNQVQYAAHRGVTKQAIADLIKRGRISLEPSEDPNRKGKVIDVAAADRALNETRERINTRDDAPAPRADYVPPPDGGAAGGRLTQARTATEVYRARLAQLEYDEKIGKLRRVDDVIETTRRAAELIVRDLEALAAGSDDLVAAFREGGEAAHRVALKNLVRRVQATVSENLRVQAAAPPPAPVSAVVS